MPNVTVDSSILWFVWIYMMIFQWGLSKAIQTVAVQRLPLLVSVLFYHGYSSLPRPWCCWVNFLKKKPASRPLSFDHPVPVQGSHSFPSMEKLASHRTILPCRRKKCSSLEVVVLWRSLECHDHRKSRYIMIYQDISRYIKIYQDVRRIQKQLEQGLFEFHTSRSIRWIWICRDPHHRWINRNTRSILTRPQCSNVPIPETPSACIT